jgi:hypothetical protein
MTPRSASERLVAEARARLVGRRARVADVGTGGGAIAIAVALELPDVEVWATDTSRNAVVLARANVRRHGLEDRVFVRRCDLLDEVPAPVDLIVANLPYVPASAAAEHPDLWAEPFGAVFAPGDGLGPYRRLIDAAPSWLADDGRPAPAARSAGLRRDPRRASYAPCRARCTLLRARAGGHGGRRLDSGAAARPTPHRSRTSDNARAVRDRLCRKPHNAEAIFVGRKTVEFRRSRRPPPQRRGCRTLRPSVWFKTVPRPG